MKKKLKNIVPKMIFFFFKLRKILKSYGNFYTIYACVLLFMSSLFESIKFVYLSNHLIFNILVSNVALGKPGSAIRWENEPALATDGIIPTSEDFSKDEITYQLSCIDHPITRPILCSSVQGQTILHHCIGNSKILTFN